MTKKAMTNFKQMSQAAQVRVLDEDDQGDGFEDMQESTVQGSYVTPQFNKNMINHVSIHRMRPSVGS